MADDVYRFTCPDGDFAWHGSVADLRKAHPKAVVTGHLVMDEVGQGSWEPYDAKQAKAAPKNGEAANEGAAEPEAVVVVEVEEKPAKKAAK